MADAQQSWLDDLISAIPNVTQIVQGSAQAYDAIYGTTTTTTTTSAPAAPAGPSVAAAAATPATSATGSSSILVLAAIALGVYLVMKG